MRGYRSPEGRELIAALVAAPGQGGGVFLTNMRMPWLSHEILGQKRPDIITCTIEGNPDGSSAVDYTVNCGTGYPAMTGHGSPESPVNHALPAWDLACAYQAAFSISSALLKRSLSGRGSELRIALSDVAFATLSNLGLLAEAELFQDDRASIGNYLYGAFGRDFETSDGKRVYLAAISVSQWHSLVKACDLGACITALERRMNLDFGKEQDRFEAREAIGRLLEQWCGARSADQIGAILSGHGVLWGRYRTVLEALREDARVGVENPLFQRIETAGVGAHLAAGSPIRQAGVPQGRLAPAPVLGQHTDAILQEVLGLSAGEVGRLHDAGIVAGASRDPLSAS